MSDRKQLGFAVLTAVALCASADIAFAQVVTPNAWVGTKTDGAGPSHAASAPAIVTIDGFKYGLAESALKNLDAVKVLIDVADAMGIVRNNDYENPGYNTIGGSAHTWEYRANGTVNGQQVNLIVGMDYRGPSVREQISNGPSMASATDAKSRPAAKAILVATGKYAWDESKIGVYSGAAKTSAADRLLQLQMLPAAVVFDGVAAPDKIKLTTSGDTKTLTVPVPAYSTELKATINKADQIVHLEMNANGKLYSADFSDYQNDRMDYHVFFPHKIVQKVDGNTVSDLTVYEHWTGPYMVWPVPREVKPS